MSIVARLSSSNVRRSPERYCSIILRAFQLRFSRHGASYQRFVRASLSLSFCRDRPPNAARITMAQVGTRVSSGKSPSTMLPFRFTHALRLVAWCPERSAHLSFRRAWRTVRNLTFSVRPCVPRHLTSLPNLNFIPASLVLFACRCTPCILIDSFLFRPSRFPARHPS